MLPGLKYEEEGLLIELMVCAMRQAAEVTPPVGRSLGRKVTTDKRDRFFKVFVTFNSAALLKKIVFSVLGDLIDPERKGKESPGTRQTSHHLALHPAPPSTLGQGPPSLLTCAVARRDHTYRQQWM